MTLSVKVLRRSARNLLLRDTPYFAHLCLTHRCNLRCDYCGLWAKTHAETDLASIRRILQVIDAMGCAVVSLTGGEPLLREDVCDVIEYAKSLELYVRITTNGTLPLSRYERLLQTGIDAIAVSIDGVHGNDLPHSKVSPRILETLQYLVEHRGQKLISVAAVLHNGNADEMHAIIDHVKRYKHVGVFIQPVVAGDGGAFRVPTQERVDPAFLKGLPIADPDFFIDGCSEYARSRQFDWRCKAGQLFFDVKPNGDFWICQDYPTGLNVLAADFLDRWRAFDFRKLRDRCGGCVYSCYYVTQHAFLPRNWGDMLAASQRL